MDFLKVFATFDGHLNLADIASGFVAPLLTYISDETLFISSDQLELSVVECSAGEFLLRGDVSDIAYLEQHVIPPLTPIVQTLQMDIFEEDGRLCKRIITG